MGPSWDLTADIMGAADVPGDGGMRIVGAVGTTGVTGDTGTAGIASATGVFCAAGPSGVLGA